MPLYDAVKDLTLTIERVELEPHVLPLKHLTRRTTVFHLHGSGEEGVGEDVTYEEAHHQDVELPDLTGEHTVDSFSKLVADEPGYRIWGLESAALDLALRQAGSSLAAAVGREPRPVTFVVSQSAVKELLATLPRDPLQARCERQVDGRRRRGARRDRRRRRRRLQGPVRRRLGRGDAVGGALRPRRRGVPAGLARGRAHQRRDAPSARAAPRPAHLGLPDPLGRRRRRRSNGRRAASTRSRRASGASSGSSTSTTTARRTRSGSTAAASSSSAPAAARSSTSPRSSIPMRRMTSRRRSTTRAVRGRGCRRARCRLRRATRASARPTGPRRRRGSTGLRADDRSPGRRRAGERRRARP